MIILGIETSCDDTSIAVFDDEKLLAMETNSQIRIHNKTWWVVPEVAARVHAENILEVLEIALKKAGKTIEGVDYIAVTTNPWLLSSILTWTVLASTISTVLQKPILDINHIQAHIFANFLERKEEDIKFPLVCLTVSWWHNDIYYMENMWDMEKLWWTGDDAAWEAFDKVAKMLWLPYPWWPHIAGKAEDYEKNMLNKIKNIWIMGKNKELFPRVFLDKKRFDFSFSGLKSAVKREIDNRKLEIIKKKYSELSNNELREILKKEDRQIKLSEKDICEIAYEFENAVIEVLAYKLIYWAELYGVNTVMLAWWVSANTKLKRTIENLAKEKNLEFIYPKSNLYSMDNAAMVGMLAYYKIKYWKFENKIWVVAP